ncbi:MAG: AMP-binding protein [Spirochaetia bacterium]|jgi:long-chain acyl-CoA synthetase|nr:AMP-binding protein [Spirochaetia bacterium]
MTLTKRLKAVSHKYPDSPALYSKNSSGEFQITKHSDFYQEIEAAGAGFMQAGVKRGDHIGIISDNRREWIISDFALMGIGAADVPRGSDSTALEISFILKHADCRIVIAENQDQALKILEYKGDLPVLEKIILFDSDESRIDSDKKGNIEILLFKAITTAGRKMLESDRDLFNREIEKGNPDDLATIIYTSGTTGKPKGVMLTHRNFIFQLDRINGHYIQIKPAEIMMSILPVWHSFERTCEYIFLDAGGALAYSQPVGSILIADMALTKPQWIVSVPRIWEGVRGAILRKLKTGKKIKRGMFFFFLGSSELYNDFLAMFTGTLPQFNKRNRLFDITVSVIPLVLLLPLKLLGSVLVFSKIKKLFGGRLILGISGGGALPPHVRRFFNAMGIKVNEGYGLTETGPVLSVCTQKKTVHGTVGPLLPDVEFKVVNKNMESVSHGNKGILYVKSDQVMKGYYNNEEETQKVLKDGWLNTGDIVIATINREVKIIGRAKETIVLMGGENIEPLPIEDKCLESDLIDQIIVLGQDKKYISALIVPNMELMELKAAELEIPYMDIADLLSSSEINNLIEQELKERINVKNGFKHFEKIFRFKLLSKPFEVGKELTQTLKLRRSVINEMYAKEIKELFR